MSVLPEEIRWRIAEEKVSNAAAMEVRQPAALWALRRRTQVSCLAFLLRWFLVLEKFKTSSSERVWSSRMDQLLGFSILTTTGVPLCVSSVHQLKGGDIFIMCVCVCRGGTQEEARLKPPRMCMKVKDFQMGLWNH